LAESLQRETPVRLALYASGGGSNVEALCNFFRDRPDRAVALVLSDQPQAPVVERARNAGIPVYCLSSKERKDGAAQLAILRSYGIDFIALAGYMRLVPKAVVAAYARRMLNIHPSLLPKYGGQGMYGDRVHEAVIAAGERESGITIHWVSDAYDEGAIVEQHRLTIPPAWDAAALKKAVQELEWTHYPRVIDAVIERELQHKE
jgi:phosphoribosylglycinamide formyltransferase-1